MTSKDFPAVTSLIQAFRSTQGPSNLLALECFLLCAEKPRTIAELVALTGCANGPVNRAVRTLTPYWDAKTEKVVRPEQHLLQRRRVWAGKGHRYHLTSKGRALLAA
jgi:hypothetical protein